MTASHRAPLKIILDSNAFFIPLEFKMDIYQELRQLLGRSLEFILLSPVKKELETLANADKPTLHRQATFALQVAKKCKLVVLENKEDNVDDFILRTAQRWNTAVFTNDRILKKKLRDISVPVIYLRQKTRLDVDGLIS